MALRLHIEKIEKERIRRKLKKQDIAKQLKVSNGMVTQIYRKKPLKYADKFAKIFDFDPKDLII